VAKPALVVIGLVLAGVGAGAAGYAWTRPSTGGMTPTGSAAMASAVGQLDGDIKAARATVHERATTLAGLQAVQGAITTDPTTAQDMRVRGELAFNPQPGEVLELGQLAAGKPPAVLLVQPDGGMRSAHAGTPGRYADLMGDQIAITEVVPVTPHDLSTGKTGYVAVTRPLDLGAALGQVEKAGLAGRLDIAGKTRAIGTPPPGATETATPLPSLANATLVIAAPALVSGRSMPLVAGGAGLAGVGLIVLLAGLLGKRASGAIAGAVSVNAPTMLSGNSSAINAGVAAGTPSPVDTSSVSISPAALGPGAVIGRWEIIKRLGSGGMADVYLARARGEAGFERQVAVKVMHPHLARNDRAVEHFLDEARLASRISHPNVVAIQDLGKIGTDYVIVMEYVDGVDLDRLLTSARVVGRQVPVDVALGIICRICDGLNAAHHSTTTEGAPQGLVHRDVKAANVLISKQGGVKVVDFGIAKAASQVHMTMAGETKGTPSMMAPEQRVGEQVDVRADVYSTAAVAFEILTGQQVNLDLAVLAHLGLDNWPHLPPPSTLRPELPPELDRVLLTAMSYDRDRRPADCAALEASFESIMKANGLSASDKDIARWVAGELGQAAQPAINEGAQTRPRLR